MKIATWNVNGIRARELQFREWLERDRPDIICIQEIKASNAQIPASICALEGYDCYWHGERAYSGVGLHVRKGALPHPPVFAHPTFNFENRIVTAEFGKLVVASIYVPNGGKDFPAKIRFLEQLEAYTVENLSAGKDLILCGDINIARSEQDVHPKERNPRVIGQTPDERALLERILGRGLVDLGRSLDPANDQLFTWWPPWRNMRQRDIGWRLDYLFASAGVADRVSECKVLAEVGTSDHAPVIATIDPAPTI